MMPEIQQRVVTGPVVGENFLILRDVHLKRKAVRQQTDDLLEGRPTKIYYLGRLYTIDDVMDAVANHDLFQSAALAAYTGNVHSMKDLIRRVAQFAICEHLCPGESVALGFLP